MTLFRLTASSRIPTKTSAKVRWNGIPTNGQMDEA